MFNPVAAYGYLLPTVYLFMEDIANPDLFVCGCWTWIYLDITRFYDEHRQPSSGFAWPACENTVNRSPIYWGGGFNTISTSVCNRCDSSIACKRCRLEPQLQGHQLRFSSRTHTHRGLTAVTGPMSKDIRSPPRHLSIIQQA